MKERAQRKEKIGTVVSNKMDKTITVAVERKIQHPLVKKYIKKSVKLHAHDKNNDCQIGDVVKVIETKPLSKSKNWRLVEVVERVK